MAATAEHAAAGQAGGEGTGRVARVIGPIVDVEFGVDGMPDIYNALHVDVAIGERTATFNLEGEPHIGDNTVRAFSMPPTGGKGRRAVGTDTRGPASAHGRAG